MTPQEALEHAVAFAGSMQALADHLGVTKGAVSQWKLDGRQVPAKHCAAIETLTKGTSRREDLRPDLFATKPAGALRTAPRRATDPEPPAAPARPFRQPPSSKNVMELQGLDGSRHHASVPVDGAAPADDAPDAP